MAMFDDRAFLIAHIRNSFITSDDTGMCELVLENDEGVSAAGIERERQLSFCERRPSSWPYQSSKDAENAKVNSSITPMESDMELSHSCDIVPDMDFGGHRRRSNTAQRLAQLQRDKQKTSQIKRVQWKNVKAAGDGSELFPTKVITRASDDLKPQRSALSIQLEQFDSKPNNPFLEFAKYDGKAAGSIPVKKIDIYLTMAPPGERAYPMTVITLASATVHNLVGLICWQYSAENRSPPLSESIDHYSLYMVEDDGEVDMDFPPLEKREPISKFGFAKLALVEKQTESRSKKSTCSVSVQIPGERTITVTLDDDSSLLKDVLDKAIADRNIPCRTGLSYRLEKLHSPGQQLDLDQPLSAVNCSEFIAVRENSARETVDDDVADALAAEISNMAQSASSLNYESFTVQRIHKLRANSQVRFSVSGDKIEVYPMGVDSRSLARTLLRVKAVTHHIQDIISCTVLEHKPPDRAVFRLTCLHLGGIKKRDFEADSETAKNIVTKITNIRDFRLNYSMSRNSMLTPKFETKKPSRRHTLRV